MKAARMTLAWLLIEAMAGPGACGQATQVNTRPRARDLGIRIGTFETGPNDAITDVPGLRVGHATVVEGAPGPNAVRTGVTAIMPHAGNAFEDKVAAAVYVFNAFGKLVGSAQVNELGQLETPILLTNTLSVWDAAAAMTDYMLTLPGNENVRSINPVVGETNDGFLNDIRGRHVKAEHVRAALATAGDGPVAEGSVGAGTGTTAFGWKGGIGTASRVVPVRNRWASTSLDKASKQANYTVGVLVQSNFGGRLTIAGFPVWELLRPEDARPTGDGSCMIVVATDAPLDHRQLHRLAARAIFGMTRTGSSGSNGSGDFVIAFSTTNRYHSADEKMKAVSPVLLRDDDLSPLFAAVADATEEAIVNSLLRATTVTGRDGNTARAIPIERLRELLTTPRAAVAARK